jgi:hypothetical protein
MNMKTKDYLPKNDHKLLQWVINFLNRLSVILARLGFPLEVYEALQALRGDFEAKLEVAEAPTTRTRGAIDDKNVAKKKLNSAVRAAVQRYLAHNPDVTEKDHDDLGLPNYKTTRTPAPVADEAPDFDVNTSVIGHIIIAFFEKGSNHKKAKPVGQHCVEIGWAQSDTPVTRWDELTHSNVDTNSPFTLSFENDQRGKTIYFALRWENTRGDKGPWSTITSAIIP